MDDNKNLIVKLDTVITVGNGTMQYISYRDEKTGHIVTGRFEELNMEETVQAFEAIQRSGATQ